MNFTIFLRQVLNKKACYRTVPKHLKQIARSYCSVPDNKIYHAALLEKFKNPLSVQKLAKTDLADGEIRIGVKVCAVNKADIKCIEGNDSIVRLPFIPGSEFAGEILEVGKNCKEGLMPGDKVAVLRALRQSGGGLATECVVNETECLRIEENLPLSLNDVVTLIGSYGNAYLALQKLCQLKPKDGIIIIAGAGGDGLAAIQIADHICKANVSIVFDSKEVDALVQQNTDYRAYNLRTGLTKVYTSLDNVLLKKKVKIAYDCIDSNLLHVVADFIEPSGQFLTSDTFYSPETVEKPYFKKIGGKQKKKEQAAEEPSKEATTPIDWQSEVRIVDLAKYQKADPELYKTMLKQTFSLLVEKKITPYISKIYTLSEINKAVKFVQNKRCLGKVLVEVK